MAPAPGAGGLRMTTKPSRSRRAIRRSATIARRYRKSDPIHWSGRVRGAAMLTLRKGRQSGRGCSTRQLRALEFDRLRDAKIIHAQAARLAPYSCDFRPIATDEIFTAYMLDFDLLGQCRAVIDPIKPTRRFARLLVQQNIPGREIRHPRR